MKIAAILLIAISGLIYSDARIVAPKYKQLIPKAALHHHKHSKGMVPRPRDEQSDAYIDQVLEKVRLLVQEQQLDPAPLPEGVAEFSETILGITFHGSARVYNGHFNGLSQIKRTGATSLTVDPATQTIRLSAYVGIDSGNAGYDARAEIMDIGVSASASANIEGISLFLEAEMCLTEGCSLQLTKFEIDHIGLITVNFDGLGPLDYILEIVIDLVGNLIKDWIADLVEGPLKDVIQGALDNVIPDIPSWKF